MPSAPPVNSPSITILPVRIHLAKLFFESNSLKPSNRLKGIVNRGSDNGFSCRNLHRKRSSVDDMSGFKFLKLLNVQLEDQLSEEPVGVHYDALTNSLHYYVRRNTKPRMRAAVILAINVGSFLEKQERGVAHIVEHIAFSATKKYTNHDIIKFLESVGAEFGACQNASTSADETIYELLVPVDKPELLSHAMSILAEFNS